MGVHEASSLSGLSSEPKTRDEILLEYSMDFVFAVEDRLEALGMSRSELAKKLGCKKSQVTRVLSGEANITLKTIAAYDAVLGLGFKFEPKHDDEDVSLGSPSASWRFNENKKDNVIPFFTVAEEA